MIKSLHEKAFLLLSFCIQHSIGLHRSSFASTRYWQRRLQVVWISPQLLSTITSISARWTQLHQVSLAFTACIHNDACVCECEESGSELSLRHEERGKKSFRQWMKVEKWFSCWGSVGLSGILSLHLLSPLLHLYTHTFSFYPSVSSYVSGLLVFRIND